MTLLDTLLATDKSIHLQNPGTSHALVSDFGSPLAEIQSLDQGEQVLAPLGHYGLLGISGEEATDFLQKQLTNDLLTLPTEGARHAAWCTAKGRMLASFVVFRAENGYRLLVSRPLAEPIQKRLQMYILRAKVKANDLSSQYEVFGLAGHGVAKTLKNMGLPVPQSSESSLGAISLDGLTVISLEPQRFLLVTAAESAPSLWTNLAAFAKPVGVDAWRYSDIRAGFPLITAETQEAFVPQMVNFDRLGGVSFKKGCYPGQEIVARTHYLGKVKRHLYRITTSESFSAGDLLFSPLTPDQSAGQVVSASLAPDQGWIGLASVLEAAVEDLRLSDISGQKVNVSSLAGT